MPDPEIMPGSRYTREETGINFTAILDIAFVVVMLFFGAAYLAAESAGRAGFGGNSEAAGQSIGQPTYVRIGSTGLVSIDGHIHERSVIRSNLERLRSERSNTTLTITVHPDADSNVLALVLDMARELEFEPVNVETGEGL